MNFLETLSMVVVCHMITWFYSPAWANISMWIGFLGRIFYSVGYVKYGPKGRLVGAIIWDLVMLSGLIGGFVAVGKFPTAPVPTA